MQAAEEEVVVIKGEGVSYSLPWRSDLTVAEALVWLASEHNLGTRSTLMHRSHVLSAEAGWEAAELLRGPGGGLQAHAGPTELRLLYFIST